MHGPRSAESPRLPECESDALAFCWADVHRRFYALAAAGPAPIASEVLRRIAELYKIDDDIRGQSVDARRAVRQERSRSIVAALGPWLRVIANGHPDSQIDDLLPWAYSTKPELKAVA